MPIASSDSPSGFFGQAAGDTTCESETTGALEPEAAHDVVRACWTHFETKQFSYTKGVPISELLVDGWQSGSPAN